MIIGSNDRQGCHVATEMSDMKQRQAELRQSKKKKDVDKYYRSRCLLTKCILTYQSKYHMGKRSQQNLVYSDQAIVFVRNYP